MPSKLLWIALVALLMPLRAAGQPSVEPNSCLSCHAALPDQRLSTPAKVFASQDVHREKGFACVDCHGGNPASADQQRSHDTAGRESAIAFKGKPTGQKIVAT